MEQMSIAFNPCDVKIGLPIAVFNYLLLKERTTHPGCACDERPPWDCFRPRAGGKNESTYPTPGVES